jgi:hypothetical protein
MDELGCTDLVADDFGIEPVHIAAGAAGVGLLWYGHRRKWWHHLWPFGHHKHAGTVVKQSVTETVHEDMPAPEGPPVYHDELMSVESMGGFYTPEPPAPVVDETAVVVDETVETTDETLYVESIAPRRPAPPVGRFVGRPAPPIERGRPAPPLGRPVPPPHR